MPPLDYVIPQFLALLFSLSVHEAAHAWSADKLGDPTARLLGRITLNPIPHIDLIGTVVFPLIAMMNPGFPLLGWAKPVPVNTLNLRAPRRDFAVIAAAGPISNLILAVAIALVVAIVGGGPDSLATPAVERFLKQMIFLNIILAVFNLIPVPPLDGGNVAAGLLPEGIAHVINLVRPYGFIILYALMFLGILGHYVAPIALTIYDWLV